MVKSGKEQLLYKNLAQFYDLIYHWKDYKKEVHYLKNIIYKHKKSKSKNLLEVACGTGKHLEYFSKTFDCFGVDMNKSMLKIAKKRCTKVELKQGNMLSFTLSKKFDIITCLFSSIGYVKSKRNLKITIENFSRHLNPGGIVIIEPWLTKSIYRVGFPHMNTYENENIKIARLVVPRKKGNISIMDMHYCIAEKSKAIKHFVDRHELGLFETDTIMNYMKKAGFRVKFLKRGLMKDRGLFIGIKK